MTQTAVDAIPAYRHFDVTVRRVVELSPSFIRITFTGDDLDRFGDTCLDQRVKIVFPIPGTACTDPYADMPRTGDWYARWRTLPEARRNPIRTYTVRDVRTEPREVDIDFVCHGDAGIASRWARRVVVGDPCLLIGPDRRADSAMVGVEWRPGSATDLLLAGDETAVPAILSIVSELPADARGHAFLEVPEPADALTAPGPEGVELTWLARANGSENSNNIGVSREVRHGDELVPAVKRHVAKFRQQVGASDAAAFDEENLWDTPGEEPGAGMFAWLAGEATAITTLRRHLVAERGWDRRRIAFMGYWKKGKAES